MTLDVGLYLGILGILGNTPRYPEFEANDNINCSGSGNGKRGIQSARSDSSYISIAHGSIKLNLANIPLHDRLILSSGDYWRL